MSDSNPISEKRSEASRINGAKSQGPKTEEGKAISSRNAVKHGLYSSVKTMVAAENPEEFAGFHRELYRHFAPPTPIKSSWTIKSSAPSGEGEHSPRCVL